ncbi:DUF2785 domain-containing protein [Massilia sp. B-10]|nr:DUF2785 domain-containing protein [Massilia sp. B-10]
MASRRSGAAPGARHRYARLPVRPGPLRCATKRDSNRSSSCCAGKSSTWRPCRPCARRYWLSLRKDDGRGFGQPFAALTLAEIVRADRIKPFMSEAERGEVVKAATGYLASVRDYRGFDEKEGWRHGVAHGADLMLQLSVHPALGKADHEAILAAVASQLGAPGEQGHFYRYGEGERLMAPVFYLARRSEIDDAAWARWFAALTVAPGPFTQASLARRHNLKSFLQPLYVSLAESIDVARSAPAAAGRKSAQAARLMLT